MSARTTCFVLGSICCLAFPWSQAPGQVATDGTVGPRLGLAGPDYAIGAELGRRAGGNLFHSFERFSLRTGESATFSGPDDIRSVISRVTGGARSDIDGTLASTIPGADFFFVNPAGVVFGPNASLDVQGSFHVSTADELRFSDGAVFSATNPDASSLTVAAPEAFGFLSAQPAAITVDRSIVAVSPNEILELSGGDIDISGGLLSAASGTVELTAQGGDGDVSIRNQGLVSVEGEGSGRVQIRARDLTIEDRSAIVAPSFGAAVQPGGVNIGLSGTLMLTQSLIKADSFGGPTDGVVIDAADVVLDGGQIGASSFSSGQTDGVTINASERLVIGGTVLFDQPGVLLLGSRPGIFAFARADGNAGAVTVTTGDLEIRDRGQITSATVSAGDAGAVSVTVTAGNLEIRDGFIRSLSFGAGDAGSVTVTADRLTLLEGGQISASPHLESTGAGGEVQVTARDLLLIAGHNALDGPSGIFASAEGAANSDRAAGNVTVTADDLQIRDGGQITSGTLTAGDAGTVTVTAGTLELRAGLISGASEGAGNAGRVTVTADRLSLLDGGQIGSSPLEESTGAGGEVQVTAHDSLFIAGRDAGNFPSGIFASAQGAANSDRAAGNVTVTADDLQIREGGGITSGTLTAGDAGTVTVTAGTLELRAGLISSASEGAGNAGRVTVTADRLSLLEGGQISSSPLEESTGAGGEIQVTAHDSLFIAGARDEPSGIFASAEANSDGAAGNVTVTAGDLEIRDGIITSASEGAGDAGSVTVTADRLTLLEGSQIISSPLDESTGAGGQVQVTARESLLIAGHDARNNASGIFATAEGAAKSDRAAGNVTVTARDLEIRDGGQITSSTLTAGDAGSVTVTADRLTLLEGGQISSSPLLESTGAGGEVQVTARDSLLIAGGRDGPSSIFASAAGAANSDRPAGNVTVTARDLEIRDGGRIASSAFRGGVAGKVTVVADRLVLDRAEITTKSASAGGGEIQLLVGDVIDLRDSEITTSVAGGNDPTAGNIRIDPTFLIIDGSTIEADASSGSGGNVRINADNILVPEGDLEGLLARRDISASGATEEVDGTVAISAPEVDLTGDLVVLKVPLLDAASLLRERCAARRDIGASSFTGIGRGGLPPGPDQPLMSDYTTGAAGRGQAARWGTVEAEIAPVGAPTGQDGVLLLQPCAGAL